MFVYILIIYLIILNLLGVLLTYYDKKAKVNRLRRVRENTLVLTALLGGSASIYISMKLMQHKTKHSLFMVGLPLIFITEVIISVILAVSANVFS